MGGKIFSLEEARRKLPLIRELLSCAEDDLKPFREALGPANHRYDELDRVAGEGRAGEQAAEGLSGAQRDYLERLNYWVERVNEAGVILRDLHSGLIDFPSREGGLSFFLCWRMGEPDIEHWHLVGDGYAGRKPLGALVEFL